MSWDKFYDYLAKGMEPLKTMILLTKACMNYMQFRLSLLDCYCHFCPNGFAEIKTIHLSQKNIIVYAY